MNDMELERSIIRHANEAITQSEDDAIKQYGSAVIMSAELAKKESMQGEYLAQFLEEVETINKHEDTLLLVCMGMVYLAATNDNKPDLLLPELSERTFGFLMSQYYPIKKLVNARRAAELFPNDPSEETIKGNQDNAFAEDFEWLATITVGRLYKKSPLWKKKLMWQLVKEWNSPKFNSGIARLVRDKLGEDEALALFRKTVNEIMNNPELLDKAVDAYRKSNQSTING